MKKFVAYSLLLFFAPAVFAGTDPAAFLNIGVGGRAVGLGGAFTSISDDPTALYWNPAGLGKVNRISVVAMGQSAGSSQWDTLKDITPSYQFIGVTFPLRKLEELGILGTHNTLGIGYIGNTLGNIPRTYVDGSGVIVRDTMEDAERAYLISYGFGMGTDLEALYAGITFRYITQQLSGVPDATASGYDMGVGLLYGWDTTNLGLVVQKGAQVTWANGRKDSGPITTRFGISNRFTLPASLWLTGSADLIQRQSEPVTVSLGSELGYEPGLAILEALFLRLGLEEYVLENRYDYRDKLNNNVNYTLGLGVRAGYQGYRLQFDYAFGSYRLGAKNRFSISVYF